MNTINGHIDLSHTYGTSVTILNFYTGLKQDVVLVRYKKQFIRLWICPHFYSLDLEWKIMQFNTEPPTGICVKDLKDSGRILNKFNIEKDYKIIQYSNDWIGQPEGAEIWYDQNLVISK